MDLKQLGYFVKVADFGSFSKASVFLKVAQPALSRQIQNLENEHQEALFIRNGRGVELTEAGKRLLDHARGILRLVERSHEDMENARTGKSGRVTIGVPPTLSISVAAPLIRKLRQELPEAKITLLHGRSSQLQEWLLGGSIDMALVLDAPASPLLESHDIAADNLGILGAPGQNMSTHPTPLGQLAEIPVLVQARPHKIRVLVDTELAKMGKALDVVLECDAHSAIIAMAGEGMGYAIYSSRFHRDVPGAKDLIFSRIIEPEISLKSQIILPARRPASQLQHDVFHIFRDICTVELHHD